MNCLPFLFKQALNTNIAGGKGASLSRLLQSGVPVPPGFIISVKAFQEFLSENNLNLKINQLLNGINFSDQTSILNASQNIGTLIIGSPISQKLQVDIEAVQKDMNLSLMAVRSSAVSEDNIENAFAGQMDSFLNVSSNELTLYLKKCWASYFSPRAMLYRQKWNLSQSVSMAVVIQQMVQSTVSGIAFSINPTDNSDSIIIESVYGLGEGIVSGKINPDRYTIQKEEPKRIEYIKNKQKRKIVLQENKNVWVSLTSEELGKRTLSESQVQQIIQQILAIENLYGFPVDIEWAFVEDELFITQARPITTIKKKNINAELLNNIKEKGSWEIYVSRKFNWYLEATQIEAASRENQEKYFGFSNPLNNYLILDGDEYINTKDSIKFNQKFQQLDQSSPDFFETFSENILSIIAEAEKEIWALKTTDYSDFDNGQLISELERFHTKYLGSFIPAFLRPDNYLENKLRQLVKVEKQRLVFEAIINNTDINKLSYISEPKELADISAEIAKGKYELDNLPDEIISKIDCHIEKYSWMKSPVGWGDESFNKKEYIDRISYLINPTHKKPISPKIIISTLEDVIEDLKLSNATEVLKYCRVIQKFIFLRTYTTEISDLLFFTAKQTLMKEIASHLGVEIQDLIMLSESEISAALKGDKDVFQIINIRKKGFAIIWLDGKTNTMFGPMTVDLKKEIAKRYQSKTVFDKVKKTIKGEIANPGYATGKVRIIIDAKDVSYISNGEILVTQMTTPDLIGAMEKASAIVTDEGGITCHAAIISRELNVPCIVGTTNATEILRNGQIVNVDAFKGIISVLD